MKKMVKELLVVLVAVAMMICLSGCARVNYDVNVNKDGSADVSYVMGYDKEFLNSMGMSEDDIGEEDSFADVKKKATDDGYTIEDYSDDTVKGFKATKHFDKISDFNLDNIADRDVKADDTNNEFTFKKMLLDTKISQNAKLDLTDLSKGDEDSEDGSEYNSVVNMLLGQMKFSYKVTLPFKVGDNNATTVSEDGKTLEWTLTPGEVNEIRFEAAESLNTVLLACVIAAVVIVVVVVIVIGTKGKNKPSKKEVKVQPKKQSTANNKQEVKKEETTKKETKKEVAKPDESKKVKTTKKEEEKEVDEKETNKENKEDKE